MATRVNSDYIERDALANLVGGSTVDDIARIDYAITAASRYVDSICLRPSIGGARGGFWNIAAATATFRPQPGWPAQIGDWAAIGTVATSSDGGSTWSTVSASGWQAEPLNADVMGEVFTELRVHDFAWPAETSYPGRPCLRIVGTIGWSAVPEEVESATTLAAVRWYRRPDAAFGVTGGEFGPVYVRGSDPDCERILHRLIWRGA